MNRKETKTTGIEPYVIIAMVLRLKEREALEYLKDRGYSISRAEFYRIKKHVEDTKFERLSSIASREFVSQHLERIDQLELVTKEMWSNSRAETNPSKKVAILQAIVQLQPYLSQYYEVTWEIAKEYGYEPTT